MRVVLDTNITVSGLLWRGAPRVVIEAARSGQIELFSCAELLEELEDVLRRPKLAARFAQIGKEPTDLIDEYLALIAVIRADPLPAPVSVDPDDDVVLACALAAQAAAIVSGDDDLLRLSVFQDMPILTAPELLARLAPSA
ncbi:putative toxin-antitoxin system toxin component, PIN family [Oscillochloris sp. ZM17-4]|uniref:putative toxin-antitoxin system toxin component, PIN family n=1 Tax=Oscillochloris sp. ZM17-4 TaxID=2866714 RepID=UPI00101DA64F|nr:putative toxin-antitoxin system toxin component, PIN family [Oscillochloris sp. ZM17-4]NNJ12768.1 putative toxin-antitoxin system toxin component, PIN family [Chloroflexales bacterium ZM16-3]